MNDIQEAHFVAREMLPKGRYDGRLSLGVARHLSRCLPSVPLPPSLLVDVTVEQDEAFSYLARSLGQKFLLRELIWQSALPLSCLRILADCFGPSQLAVLHVRVHPPPQDTPIEEIHETFRKLSQVVKSDLHLSLGPGWNNLEPLLQGLRAAAPLGCPFVSLALPFETETKWCQVASQIRALPIIRSLDVHGGVWGPQAWKGLISCLNAPSLCGLSLVRPHFSDRMPSTGTIKMLRHALLGTKVRDLDLVNVEGSGRGGSLSLIQTILSSMVGPTERKVMDHENITGTYCPIESLTLTTRLSERRDHEYTFLVYALLARHLPQMKALRGLRTRAHPTTSTLLWQAIRENESLVCIDLGISANDILEPFLQRNRLMHLTRRFCRDHRTLEEALDHVDKYDLTKPDDCLASGNDGNSVASSAAYWLVRACLPPNIRHCQSTRS